MVVCAAKAVLMNKQKKAKTFKTTSIEVKEGDKIFIDKRFAYRNKDASFYYIVGDSTAELINQEGKKKNVYVNVSQGVLHILDDLDFKKAIHVAK